MVDRLCKEQHLTIHMNFPPDHPIEEIGRVVLALLIKYQGLEQTVAKMVQEEIENPAGQLQPVHHTQRRTSSKFLMDTLKAVHQTKWKVG